MAKERFKMPVGAHLLIVKENKVLLQRRFNTGYEDGNYSVIAGYLNGNEDVKAALMREAKEEADINILYDDIEIVGVMHRKSIIEGVDFFLIAKTWTGNIINKEPYKCDDLSWFDINNLPDNVIPYVRKAIENYTTGIYFDTYGWK